MRRIVYFLILLFILLPIAVIVALYFALQTPWASHYSASLLSHFMNGSNLRFSSIEHKMTQPYTIIFHDLVIENSQDDTILLQADQASLVLDRHHPFQIAQLEQLHLTRAQLNNSLLQAMPIQSIQWIYLDNLSISTPIEWPFSETAQMTVDHLSGTIDLWQRDPAQNPTVNTSFYLTAKAIEITPESSDSMRAEQLLFEGTRQDQRYTLTTFAGHYRSAMFLADLTYLPHHELNFRSLKIDRWNAQWHQLPQLNADMEIHIQQLEVLQSNLLTPFWNIEYFDLTAEGLHFADQHFDFNQLQLNASHLQIADHVLEQPVIELYQTPSDAITLSLLGGWQRGQVAIKGQYHDHHLTLDSLFLSGIHYELPTYWWRSWPFSSAVQQVTIQKFTLLPSLILSTDPSFPFEWREIEAYGQNLVFHHITGTAFLPSEGSLKSLASSATLKTIAFHDPVLQLSFEPSMTSFHLNALSRPGFISLSGTLNHDLEMDVQLQTSPENRAILPQWFDLNEDLNSSTAPLNLSGNLNTMQFKSITFDSDSDSDKEDNRHNEEEKKEPQEKEPQKENRTQETDDEEISPMEPNPLLTDETI